jgi:hypothetical protein
VKRLRLLNPCRIRNAVRQIREASSGGGPKEVRLAGISDLEGWIVPTARVTVEIVARDGSVTRFQPQVPLPFLYAWAYRLARRLGVPLVSDIEPGRLRLGVPIPGR